VVTDVGESGILVGNTGKVVPPRDSLSLASAWDDLLNGDPTRRRNLGKAARRRIEEAFSLEQAVRRYESLYREVAGNVRH
jgi:glycosyltransferase involved in cell wall biosynthesis